jgi:hypothetical protein
VTPLIFNKMKCEADKGNLPVAVVGDGYIAWFAYELTEEGQRDGVEIEEVLRCVTECHQVAENMP